MPDPFHHGISSKQKTEGARPIRTVNSAVIGVVGTAPDADPAEFPLNTPVLVLGSPAKAAMLDTVGNGEGSLPAAMGAILDQIGARVVVVRVEEDADPATQDANIIGTVDGNGDSSGLEALKDAQATLGVKPRIIGVPGGLDDSQAVADAIASVTEHLNGFCYVWADANTKEEAVTYRGNFGSKYMMLLWPKAKYFVGTSEVFISSVATALGLRAKIDHEMGWHKTISNIPASGILGLEKAVDFDFTNPNTAANYLNENEITTIVRQEGFRFWGSRTCSSDPLYAFEAAVRTEAILEDTIAEAHFHFIDLPMSKTLIKEILEGINAKFREMKANEEIVHAEAYLDQDLNTVTTLGAGKLNISYDFTPVPPLENLGLIQTITNKYLIQLVT